MFWEFYPSARFGAWVLGFGCGGEYGVLQNEVADLVAREEAEALFDGDYELTRGNSYFSNGSLSLAVDSGLGISITSEMVNGTDQLAAYQSDNPGELRLFPAGLESKNRTKIAIWMIHETEGVGGSWNTSCTQWLDVNSLPGVLLDDWVVILDGERMR